MSKNYTAIAGVQSVCCDVFWCYVSGPVVESRKYRSYIFVYIVEFIKCGCDNLALLLGQYFMKVVSR